MSVTQSLKALDVIGIAGRSYRFFFRNFLSILMVLPFPFLLILSAAILRAPAEGEDWGNFLNYLVGIVSYALGISLLAIIVHRLVVLGERPSVLLRVPFEVLLLFLGGALLADGIINAFEVLRIFGLPGLREPVFLKDKIDPTTLVMVTLLWSIVIDLVVLVLSLYIWIKLALMFPKIAVCESNEAVCKKEEGYFRFLWSSIRFAFSSSRNRFFEIFSILLLMLIPHLGLLVLCAWFQEVLSGSFVLPLGHAIHLTDFINSAFEVLVTAIVAIAISFCYLDITKALEEKTDDNAVLGAASPT